MAYLLQAQYVGTVPGLTDQNSGSRRRVSTMFPACPRDWWWVGQRAYPGYGRSLPKSDLVFRAHPDTDDEVLVAARSWTCVWRMSKGWAMWRAVAPDGYVALGDVFHYDYPPDHEETFHSYACVRLDCVRAVPSGHSLWDDRGTGARCDASMWSIPDGTDNPWQRFLVRPDYGPPEEPGYTVDRSVVEIIRRP
jgi:hypothetical protein